MSFAIYTFGMIIVVILFLFRKRIWKSGESVDPISIELKVSYWLVAVLVIAGLVVLLVKGI